MGPSGEVIVVGAGAAGLWAAARTAELGLDVLVLEKTPRTGTKVLASGGGRCNLTTTLPPDEAARRFGPKAERFLRRAFRSLTPTLVRDHFHGLGVPTVEEAMDKIFPASGRARDVRDALETWGRAGGVRIETECRVRGVRAESELWHVHAADGRSWSAPQLFLCAGGKSYPRTGTTGEGYDWLADLGLEIAPLAPALVPVRSPDEDVGRLAGISLPNPHVRLQDSHGRRVGSSQRPILFTHVGLSGPGAMDLSEAVARAEASGGEAHRFLLDLVPDLGRDELRQALIALGSRAGAPKLIRVLAPTLERELPRRLVALVLERSGLAAGVRANELTRASRHAVVEGLKGFGVEATGTLGYDQAEVTAGGLALHQVDPGSMRVRGYPGLFCFGELLDYAGPIGGLNFQAAFSCAELAAHSAARGT